MVEEGKIKVKHINTTMPSPFAFNVVLQAHTDVMRMEDKIDFLRRMHQKILAQIGPPKQSSSSAEAAAQAVSS